VQATRLATSFELLTELVALTGPVKIPRKATCVSVFVFLRKSLKPAGYQMGWHFSTRVVLRIFEKKQPKRTWLCAGIFPLLYRLRTWSKRQKTRQVS